MNKNAKRTVCILFAAYSAIMLYLLFCRSGAGFSKINLIPFKTIKEFWLAMLQSFGTEWGEALFISSFINLAGNVVMFVPLGFFPPLIWKAQRRFFPDMALCAAVIIAVEFMQHITGLGSADIDDLILNMIGAATGFGIYVLSGRIIHRRKPKSA